jgi:hypothetical protein
MLRTGIITTYLTLRWLVGRGFLDTYPALAMGSTFRSHCSFVYSDLAAIRDGNVRVGFLPKREEILIVAFALAVSPSNTWARAMPRCERAQLGKSQYSGSGCYHGRK